MKITSKVLFILALLSAVSCSVSVKPGYIEADKKTTEQAIERFHERFNATQYLDIYNDAHENFKGSQKQADSFNAMKQTYEHFGRAEQVEEKWLNVIIGAPIQIRAVYNTKFEKGDATESFIFIKEGDTVKLALYQINPGKVRPEPKQNSKL